MIHSMEVTRTTIIREGDANTANARYDCEYTVVSNELVKLSAVVYVKRPSEVLDADGHSSIETVEEQAGTIVFRAGRVEMTEFLFSDKIGIYMQEFVCIVQEIVSPT